MSERGMYGGKKSGNNSADDYDAVAETEFG